MWSRTIGFDNFCLYAGWGIRAGYHGDRIVLALYRQPVLRARRRSRPERPPSPRCRACISAGRSSIGLNRWYLKPGGAGGGRPQGPARDRPGGRRGKCARHRNHADAAPAADELPERAEKPNHRSRHYGSMSIRSRGERAAHGRARKRDSLNERTLEEAAAADGPVAQARARPDPRAVRALPGPADRGPAADRVHRRRSR